MLKLCNFQKNNIKEKLVPHPVPDRPWKKVTFDLFEWHKHDYLLVVDYFLKYPEIKQLGNKTVEHVIKELKVNVHRHGILEDTVGDNIPLNRYKYRQFAT